MVHTKTWDEYVSDLKRLFIHLKEANLTARPSKCVVDTGKIEFIGHKVQDLRGFVRIMLPRLKCTKTSE